MQRAGWDLGFDTCSDCYAFPSPPSSPDYYYRHLSNEQTQRKTFHSQSNATPHTDTESMNIKPIHISLVHYSCTNNANVYKTVLSVKQLYKQDLWTWKRYGGCGVSSAHHLPSRVLGNWILVITPTSALPHGGEADPGWGGHSGVGESSGLEGWVREDAPHRHDLQRWLVGEFASYRFQ